MSDRDFGLNARGYRVEVRREEDGSFTLSVPALSGLVAAGETFEQAWADLPEVIDLWREAARAEGQLVPQPDADDAATAASGRFALRMPKSLHAAVTRRAQQDGTSINTFCIVALTHAVTAGSLSDRGARGSAGQVRDWAFVSRQYEFHALQAPQPGLRLIQGGVDQKDRLHAH